DRWVQAFARLAAHSVISGGATPSLLKSALDHAGVADPQTQEAVARLYNANQAFPQAFIAALQTEPSLSKSAADDIATSFHLSDLTRGDFSVVKMIKDEFDVRTPAQIRKLAMHGKGEWVELIKTKQAAGTIALPINLGALPGQSKLPDAETYGQ